MSASPSVRQTVVGRSRYCGVGGPDDSARQEGGAVDEAFGPACPVGAAMQQCAAGLQQLASGWVDDQRELDRTEVGSDSHPGATSGV